MILSDTDKKQIASRGISEQQVENQLKQFEQGFPFLKLEAAASIGQGIIAPEEGERNQYIEKWNSYKKSFFC